MCFRHHNSRFSMSKSRHLFAYDADKVKAGVTRCCNFFSAFIPPYFMAQKFSFFEFVYQNENENQYIWIESFVFNFIRWFTASHSIQTETSIKRNKTHLFTSTFEIFPLTSFLMAIFNQFSINMPFRFEHRMANEREKKQSASLKVIKLDFTRNHSQCNGNEHKCWRINRSTSHAKGMKRKKIVEEEQIDGLCLSALALVSIGHTMNKHKCGGNEFQWYLHKNLIWK